MKFVISGQKNNFNFKRLSHSAKLTERLFITNTKTKVNLESVQDCHACVKVLNLKTVKPNNNKREKNQSDIK